MNEVWKDIEGYEGQYQVSNLGRVKSFKRGGNILVNIMDSRGYYQVQLYNGDGSKVISLVHRLVASAFTHNTDPDKYDHINHIDMNRANNKSSNLEWCDSLYNNDYSLAKTYLFKAPDGYRMEIRNLSKFSRENKLTVSAMCQVNKGKRNHHKGWTRWTDD